MQSNITDVESPKELVPAAQGLTWTDCYFKERKENFVAVFDHDYRAILRFELKCYLFFLSIRFLFLVIPSVLILAAALMASSDVSFVAWFFICLVLEGIVIGVRFWVWWYNLKSMVYAIHSAITEEGVIGIIERHWESYCFFCCRKIGRTETLTPFDNISCCHMDDPDHRTWLCFRFSPRGIHTVTMESQGGNNCVLFGLKEPKKFVEVVMAMKHKRDEHKRRMIIAGAEGAGLESQNALLASLKEIASTNRRMVHALSMNSSINKSDGTCPTANITIPSSMDDDSTARSSSMDDSAVWSLDDSKRAMDDSHLSLSPRDIKEVIPKDMYQVDDAAKDQDKGKDLPDDSSEPEEVKETRVLPDGTKVESKLTAWSDGHSKQVIKTTRKNDDGSKSVKREIKKVSAEGKLRVSITEDITYPDGRKERIETTRGSRGSKKTKL